MPSPAAAELYAQAARALQSGDVARAELLCAALLQDDPAQPDALHLLGVAHARTGRVQSGLGFLDRAIAAQPGNPRLHNSRGNVLLENGQYHDALSAFDAAIELQPDLAIAHANRSSALIFLGQPQQALAAADRSIALNPHYPPAHSNRGTALMELKHPAQALESLDKALALAPDFIEALTTRGSALLALHQPDAAEASLEKALAIQPRFFQARVNLGQARLALNRPEEALALVDEVLREHPLDPKALLGKATILLALGRAAEAATTALVFLEKAVELVPDHPDLLSYLAATQIRVGEAPQGLATLHRLLAVAPHYDWAISGVLQAQMQDCEWKDLDDITSRALAAVRGGHYAVMPFIMASLPCTPADQLQAARTFCEQAMPPFLLPAPVIRAGTQRRHRIAYVSGDFREHPVANQIVGLIERHDRSRFDIIGVALESADESSVGTRLRSAWDEYLDVPRLDARATAQRIRELDVDVVVDMSGSTLGNRIQLYAYRPAPVQVAYLGYPGTLATGCHDYIIADASVIPASHRDYYREQVAWLPHSYQPYDSTQPPPLCSASRADEGLPEGAFVYCCFNNRFKYNPRMFDIWMRVLDQVRGSVLWLVSCPERVQQNLRREAGSRGVDPQRLVFAARKALRHEHIARYQLADLFLDTQPFNAHATASDALWAGLPVLTSEGDAFAGRVAAGMLRAVSMPEMVCRDMREYEQRAIELASPDSPLTVLRERLRESRTSQPLFDLDRYRRDLESAFERMIDTSRRGAAPESFTITG